MLGKKTLKLVQWYQHKIVWRCCLLQVWLLIVPQKSMDVSGDPIASVNSINCRVHEGKPLVLALSHSVPLLAFPSSLFNPSISFYHLWQDSNWCELVCSVETDWSRDRHPTVPRFTDGTGYEWVAWEIATVAVWSGGCIALTADWFWDAGADAARDGG